MRHCSWEVQNDVIILRLTTGWRKPQTANRNRVAEFERGGADADDTPILEALRLAACWGGWLLRRGWLIALLVLTVLSLVLQVLGGVEITRKTLDHAAEMLAGARRKRA